MDAELAKIRKETGGVRIDREKLLLRPRL